jgi:hypothetical protein
MEYLVVIVVIVVVWPRRASAVVFGDVPSTYYGFYNYKNLHLYR